MLRATRIFRCNQHSGSILNDWYTSIRADFNGHTKALGYSTDAAASLKDVIHERQSETKRSIIVKVDNPELGSGAYNYCKQFGEIRNAIAYTMEEQNHHVLIEYKDEESVQETFKYCGYMEDAVPWANPYLTLNSSALKKSNTSMNTNVVPIKSTIKEQSVLDSLKQAESVDEQISILYENARLNDLSIRLRFMGAKQAQDVLNQHLPYIFHNAQIHPFGSSLNGFGRMGCDLDMVLRFKKDNRAKEINADAPLEFLGKEHPKESTDEMHTLEGSQIKCIGTFLDYYLPGLDKISAFCNTRVPIVRYTDTNIDNVIDLSVNNLDSFQITELMYTFGKLDPRVKPFTFLTRIWEKEFKERQFKSRENLTNFQLTYMALSFLQNLNEPVLPTYNEIVEQLTNNDAKQLRDLLNQDFMFDVSRIQFKSKNTSSVYELFKQFLEYYTNFDFTEHMITLKTTEKISKIEPYPLYLENIFVENGVWGDSVSEFECNYFKLKTNEALKELQHSQKKAGNDEAWGLLKVLPLLK